VVEHLLGQAQAFFGALALGHVEIGSDQAQCPA
jgi:hypothetical protein